ncbi:hypothetical protein M514_12797 [Trichuris suis]|uniref:RNA-directed DNA polymerase n=1 Tax=Trichuris suis TaxID=68888 RepID=A0A085N3G5_9BILA|nr:hypothetical protein M514_12797 [Trichuris suis]
MSPRMLRWCLLLSAYDYELLYRPSAKVANADGLSRLPMPSADTEIPPPGDILLPETEVETPVDARAIKSLTRRDRTLAQVLRWALRAEIRDHGAQKLLAMGKRVIIPEKVRSRVLKLLHETHPGTVRMKALARSYVWWPRLDNDIEDTVKKCRVCQETRNAPNRAPVNPWERAERPWSRLHVDFAGPFQGQLFLIVVDSHSKWLDVSPVQATSAKAVIDKLALLFATHRLPEVIVTDNGTAFTASEFKEFMRANTIRHVTVAPYHPSSNGQAERTVQAMKQALRKIIHGSWSLRLARFLFNQHLTPHMATGSSPAEILMSRRPRSLLDNLHPDSLLPTRSRQEQEEQLTTGGEKTRRFSPGDPVYMGNYNSSPKSTVASISRMTGPRSYVVRTPEGGNERRHIDQIRERFPHTSDDSEETNDGEPQSEDKDTQQLGNDISANTPEANLDTHERMLEGRPKRHRTSPKYLRDYI